MGTSKKYLDFSVEEYKQRVNNAQRLMKVNNIDGLFVTQLENIYYFSGYISWLIRASKHRPTALLIAQQGNPCLIIPDMEVETAQDISWVDDIRGWRSNYIDIWIDSFKELHCFGGTIGAELGEESNLGMPILDWEELKSRADNTQWVDAQSLIYELRHVKSPQEVEYMREACRIASTGCEAAWACLSEAKRTGVDITEYDIHKAMTTRMMQEGALTTTLLAIRTGPEQGLMPNKYATNRILKNGDWVWLDYGAIYKNYNSDMIRVACFGNPPKGWDQFHEIQLDIAAQIRQAIRPGVTVRQLCDIKHEAFAERGFSEPWIGIGHCIGLNVHELPRINPSVEAVLEPGMCFTVEPGFTVNGNIFCIEDDVLVTEDGCEELTTFPRDLYIA